MDDALGKIMSAVTAAGQDEKTLVFFSSDNGPWLIHLLNGGSAGPFRDGKTTTWEVGKLVCIFYLFILRQHSGIGDH